MPEAPGIRPNPAGVCTMASSSVQRPSSTCSSVCCGARPSSTSTLARPRVAIEQEARAHPVRPMLQRDSRPRWSCPRRPLPPVTAMTCTGSGCTAARRPAVCTVSNLANAMRHSTELAHQQLVAGRGIVSACQQHRRAPPAGGRGPAPDPRGCADLRPHSSAARLRQSAPTARRRDWSPRRAWSASPRAARIPRNSAAIPRVRRPVRQPTA